LVMCGMIDMQSCGSVFVFEALLYIATN
jgi:hypothetical protein